MTYSETIDYLFGLEATRGWDLKLERVRTALDALGRPERSFPSVLIAGTNGKGTTAALTHAALGGAGLRVGLYTSPHLVHFTERIRVGRDEIGEADVVDGVRRIRDCASPEETGLTFFEVATLLALSTFAERRVDVAILEVGLGGRLDATNVVEPVCSAITSIGLDHQQFLGETLAEIAREKSGVMRRGRVTVLGPRLPSEAMEAVRARADAVGSTLLVAHPGDEVAAAIEGASARDDAAVALALLNELGCREASLRVDSESALCSFRRARWPGRLEVLSGEPPLILDAAHNPESMKALCAELPRLAGGPVRLLFGALRDKPWFELAEMIRPYVSEVSVVPVDQPRSASAEEVAAAFSPHVPTRVGQCASEEMQRLVGEGAATPILVTGSLFLVGEVYGGLLADRGQQSVFDQVERSGSSE